MLRRKIKVTDAANMMVQISGGDLFQYAVHDRRHMLEEALDELVDYLLDDDSSSCL